MVFLKERRGGFWGLRCWVERKEEAPLTGRSRGKMEHERMAGGKEEEESGDIHQLHRVKCFYREPKKQDICQVQYSVLLFSKTTQKSL